MNLPVILLASLVAATPLGYVTYQNLAPDAPLALGAESAADEGAAEPAGPEHHTGIQSIDLAVAYPYPTCPLNCRMGYSWSDGGLEFVVPEGATRIEVRATWAATLPTARTLEVWLVTPDPECGENCWMAVATGEGADEVVFTYDAPAAGSYSVSSYGTGPAYVIAKQDVRLDAFVHFS